jgi:hypothetical protein
VAADALCQSSADSANLPGAFKAWLSDGVDSPDTRFSKLAGRYVRSDGVEVAASYADLTDAFLAAPVDLTADQQAVPYPPISWTNVAADGTSSGTLHCNGWTATQSGGLGATGEVNFSSFKWTEGSSHNCGLFSLHLVCVQQ